LKKKHLTSLLLPNQQVRMDLVRPLSGGHALSAEAPFISKKAVPSAPAAIRTADNKNLTS
jgi:hypothetical protein